MKASDYIVEYLSDKGITDAFGYPGGMVTHLMESFSKYKDRITAHITYHEQGAAFAACGYAQASGKAGVAYATSGPGATNLITGICNAYFDSIPVLFITGQVNTFESKGELAVRQRGFQETDIVSMVDTVTKYSAKITDPNTLKWHLDHAFSVMHSGRKGPVLLDIPMNIFRAEIDPNNMQGYSAEKIASNEDYSEIIEQLNVCKRPVILIGNGVKSSDSTDVLNKFLSMTDIPVITTMPAVDVSPEKSYGFIGAYGKRTANFIVAKSDLVICFGARLDVRQVGAKRENFAPNAKIIRVDIDSGELSYKVHSDEIQICADIKKVLNYLFDNAGSNDFSKWKLICDEIAELLSGIDDRMPNKFIARIGDFIPENSIITTDVGQNQVWIAQSLKTKKGQRIYFSGGHGAMGYSLPAAIGCTLASHNTVFSFNGDGGIQMNIQELQTVAREKLPVKIIVINNSSLGMIRHFQEMYFNSNYYQTVPVGGYTVPDFMEISKAYGIPCYVAESLDQINEEIFSIEGPQFIEIRINEPTYVFPKLEFGKPNQDQEPLLDRTLYDTIMAL
ncbi:MAG: thiamine pyrophosphate-binding protein [Ruminococcus sp.]|nr:thiamine pyrophosphate-binding protein [Ruminococcus sp.]